MSEPKRTDWGSGTAAVAAFFWPSTDKDARARAQVAKLKAYAQAESPSTQQHHKHQNSHKPALGSDRNPDRPQDGHPLVRPCARGPFLPTATYCARTVPHPPHLWNTLAPVKWMPVVSRVRPRSACQHRLRIHHHNTAQHSYIYRFDSMLDRSYAQHCLACHSQSVQLLGSCTHNPRPSPYVCSIERYAMTVNSSLSKLTPPCRRRAPGMLSLATRQPAVHMDSRFSTHRQLQGFEFAVSTQDRRPRCKGLSRTLSSQKSTV